MGGMTYKHEVTRTIKDNGIVARATYRMVVDPDGCWGRQTELTGGEIALLLAQDYLEVGTVFEFGGELFTVYKETVMEKGRDGKRYYKERTMIKGERAHRTMPGDGLGESAGGAAAVIEVITCDPERDEDHASSGGEDGERRSAGSMLTGAEPRLSRVIYRDEVNQPGNGKKGNGQAGTKEMAWGLDCAGVLHGRLLLSRRGY